ncbi:F-box protein PP2-B11-like isoform X2 [Primulina tabacum]
MLRMKTDPIIDGIEFRPVYTEVKFLPNTVSRNRRGRGGGNFSRFTSSQINESFAVDWEKFVMPDYQEIASSSAHWGFFLDGRNRKICYMLGARRLYIAGGDNPIKWEWRPHADSRFSEIAELNDVWCIEIQCKIDIKMLSPRTFYAAYLVFGLRKWSRGLNVGNTTIRFVCDNSEEDADKRARVVHLHTTENRHGDKAVTRDDGWVEVEMGNFYLADAEQGEVEARLFEKTTSKSGLIVEGIEFRPICIEISDTLSLDKKAVLPKIRIQG